MPNNDTEKAERLAASLARGTLMNHVVVNVRGHLYAVPAPIITGLVRTVIASWLKRIEVSFEAEFDITGKRVA